MGMVNWKPSGAFLEVNKMTAIKFYDDGVAVKEA